MPSAVSQRPSLRLLSRSFTAFVLAPENPIASWLAELDLALRRSAGFFADRPVIMDLTRVNLSRHDLTQLIVDLNSRGIRILGIEGADPTLIARDFPPRLRCSRIEGEKKTFGARSDGDSSPERPPKPSSLLLEESVRSGQSVVCLTGDVTVVGSVASGADVIAGGSIHIYGTLRGRALAGANGNREARIFCSRNEAELLAIDGSYQTADDMEANLRRQPIQARLDDGMLMITTVY
jgi:septum site-determining protein MinC